MLGETEKVAASAPTESKPKKKFEFGKQHKLFFYFIWHLTLGIIVFGFIAFFMYLFSAASDPKKVIDLNYFKEYLKNNNIALISNLGVSVIVSLLLHKTANSIWAVGLDAIWCAISYLLFYLIYDFLVKPGNPETADKLFKDFYFWISMYVIGFHLIIGILIKTEWKCFKEVKK